MNVKDLSYNDFENWKNEGKIRIYFFEEFNTKINYSNFNSGKKITVEKSEFTEGYDSTFNWEYYIFNEINEIKNKILITKK